MAQNNEWTSKTLVWNEDFDDEWKMASETDLSNIIKTYGKKTPPPIKTKSTPPPPVPVYHPSYNENFNNTVQYNQSLPVSHTTGSSGGNLFISFAITIGILLVSYYISNRFMDFTIVFLIVFISSTVVAIISAQHNTHKYKGYCYAGPFTVFFGCCLFWILYFPMVVYGILQIRSGLAKLKQ
jgi:hypothetical protein